MIWFAEFENFEFKMTCSVQNKKLDVLVNHLCKKKKISSQKSESVRSDKESNQLLIYESDSKDDELSSLKSDDVDSTKAKKVD